MNIINNTDFDIIAITHRIWIEGKRKKGGLDKVLDYLIKKKNLKILLIEHPLFNRGKTHISLLSHQGLENILELDTRHKKRWISWLKETKFNIKIVKGLKTKKIFFSADPLCAFPGIFFGPKFSRKYYHCVDYSDKRFKNSILNSIYYLLLKLIFIKFDLIGVVSLKTKEKLLARSCSNEKIYCIPNSPVFKNIDLNKKEDNSIICIGGGVIAKFRYENIIEIVKILKKRTPNIKFYVVGGIQNKAYFRKIKIKIQKYGLEKNFIFTKFLTAKKLEPFLKKAKIGISFYSNNVKFYMQYADPLKIREYALYGIPVICDGKTAISKEIEKNKVGFVVKTNHDAARKIMNLLEDAKLYKRISDNAILWAKKNDKTKILDRLYKKIYSNNLPA